MSSYEFPFEIQYGNLTGRYFTEWRIDLLRDLLYQTVFAYRESMLFEPQAVRIWYDADEDYHCLSYQTNGHTIMVRFYKVFTAQIDDQVGWQGCPRSSIGDFARYLRERGAA